MHVTHRYCLYLNIQDRDHLSLCDCLVQLTQWPVSEKDNINRKSTVHENKLFALTLYFEDIFRIYKAWTTNESTHKIEGHCDAGALT